MNEDRSSDAPRAASDSTEQSPSAPAETPGGDGMRALSVRSVTGMLLLAATIACGIALLLVEESEPHWGLRTATAGAGLAGGWLLGWRWPQLRVLAAACGLLLIAALAFAAGWTAIAWSSGGLGGGFLGAWSYARRGRARVATATLLVAAYAVIAAAGLLQALRGGGEWWIIAQGLASLGLGLACLRLSSRDGGAAAADTETEKVEGTGNGDEGRPPPRTRWRTVARILILLGVLLPYLALGAQILGRHLQ